MAIAYGHLHQAQGKPEASFAGLQVQLQPFREAGFISMLVDEAQQERTILWKTLVAFSELERARRDAGAADKLHAQALAEVDDIAADASELRDVFMN